jgi:C4-dicarboxylate-specific signal transduction histidine kinase
MKSLSSILNPTPVITDTSSSVPTVSLHKLVNRLMQSFCPLAVAKKSFIINDIDQAFELHADEQVLAFIVGNLLNNAISSSNGVCIRIEAVKCATGAEIRVKNNGANFYSTVAHGFSEVLAAARSMGGSINIYNQKHEGTVITLSVAA